MKELRDMRPSDIYAHINDGQLRDAKDYTFIIFGKPGPTGKTYLCNLLKKQGYNAIEITESMIACGQFDGYIDHRNHFVIDKYSKTGLIVLNKKLNVDKGAFHGLL